MGLSRETLPSLFDFNENDEIDLFDLNESSSNLNLTKEKMDKLYAKLLENEDGRDGEYSDDDDDWIGGRVLIQGDAKAFTIWCLESSRTTIRNNDMAPSR